MIPKPGFAQQWGPTRSQTVENSRASTEPSIASELATFSVRANSWITRLYIRQVRTMNKDSNTMRFNEIG